ncbi:uncharacterized protein [Palaemon carinicauda]|uniref:uncharacterized protein n=1 Tax=Palaemon carinicauda TaxID=392227 RepID=UPI0035B59352
MTKNAKGISTKKEPNCLLAGSSEISEKLDDSSEILEKLAGSSEILEKLASSSEISKKLAGSSEISEYLACTSENLEKLAGSSEISEKLSCSSEILEKLAFSSEISKKLDGSSEILEKLAGSSEILEKLAGSSEISEKLSGSSEISEKLAGSSEITEKLAGSSEISENLAGSSEISEKLTGSSEISEKLAGSSEIRGKLAGISEILGKAGCSEISEKLAGSSEISEKLTGSSEILGIASSSEISEKLAGNLEISGKVSGQFRDYGKVSRQFRGYGKVSRQFRDFGKVSLQFRDFGKVSRQFRDFRESIIRDRALLSRSPSPDKGTGSSPPTSSSSKTLVPGTPGYTRKQRNHFPGGEKSTEDSSHSSKEAVQKFDLESNRSSLSRTGSSGDGGHIARSRSRPLGISSSSLGTSRNIGQLNPSGETLSEGDSCGFTHIEKSVEEVKTEIKENLEEVIALRAQPPLPLHPKLEALRRYVRRDSCDSHNSSNSGHCGPISRESSRDSLYLSRGWLSRQQSDASLASSEQSFGTSVSGRWSSALQRLNERKGDIPSESYLQQHRNSCASTASSSNWQWSSSAPDELVAALSSPSARLYSALKRKLHERNSSWVQEFLRLDGLAVLFDSLAGLCERGLNKFTDAILQVLFSSMMLHLFFSVTIVHDLH